MSYLRKRSLMESFKKLGELLDQLTGWVVTSALLLATAVGLYEVIQRYVFNRSTYWTAEIILYSLIWVYFLGISMAYRSGSHMAMLFVQQSLPKKGRKVINIVLYIITILFFTILIIKGWQLALIFRGTLTPEARFSIFWGYVAIPVGALITVVQIIDQLYSEYCK